MDYTIYTYILYYILLFNIKSNDSELINLLLMGKGLKISIYH